MRGKAMGFARAQPILRATMLFTDQDSQETYKAIGRFIFEFSQSFSNGGREFWGSL
jgi:hypothetical protein